MGRVPHRRRVQHAHGRVRVGGSVLDGAHVPRRARAPAGRADRLPHPRRAARPRRAHAPAAALALQQSQAPLLPRRPGRQRAPVGAARRAQARLPLRLRRAPRPRRASLLRPLQLQPRRQQLRAHPRPLPGRHALRPPAVHPARHHAALRARPGRAHARARLQPLGVDPRRAPRVQPPHHLQLLQHAHVRAGPELHPLLPGPRHPLRHAHHPAPVHARALRALGRAAGERPLGRRGAPRRAPPAPPPARVPRHRRVLHALRRRGPLLGRHVPARARRGPALPPHLHAGHARLRQGRLRGPRDPDPTDQAPLSTARRPPPRDRRAGARARDTREPQRAGAAGGRAVGAPPHARVRPRRARRRGRAQRPHRRRRRPLRRAAGQRSRRRAGTRGARPERVVGGS